ncbi:MAG: HEPN domain protein [Candidatus Scalindua rubra]|uniref:HEPN domain protein n=1 Tax=Candidatus Scalindua rubra TaxID=1872076 RepID=A0A1E3XEK3_9BACT|nr:MAG: HEPN domain protein [Candidatus Scalindua rubra]
MDEDTRILIKVRIESSNEDLATARELLGLKRYRAAVNRAYYAIFSITNAVLLTKKIERSKHAGVEAAFIQHFVKKGIFDNEYGRIFDFIRKKSEESDYSAKIKIYEETAKRLSEKLKNLSRN